MAIFITIIGILIGVSLGLLIMFILKRAKETKNRREWVDAVRKKDANAKTSPGPKKSA